MNIFVIGYGQIGGKIRGLLGNHGPFEPHRLPVEEMEYTTLPDVLKQQYQYRNAESGRCFSKETFMTRWDTHDHENNKVFSYQRGGVL